MMMILLVLALVLAAANLRNSKNIMAKLNELAAALTALNDQVKKIATEVQALKDSLTNVDLPPDAQAALDALTASLKAVDGLNVDV